MRSASSSSRSSSPGCCWRCCAAGCTRSAGSASRSASPCCCSRWSSRGTCCGRSSRWPRGPPGRVPQRRPSSSPWSSGIFGPTANGDRFALFQIVLATAGQHRDRAAAHRADLPTGCRGARCPSPTTPSRRRASRHATARDRSPTPTLSPRDLPLRCRRLLARAFVGRPRAPARGQQAVRVDDGGVRPRSRRRRPPRCFALLGPNGAGKTTTVEMCEGFIQPDAGTIEILGLDPVADNARCARASA